MKYHQFLKMYNKKDWNKTVYVWKSKTVDEFTGKKKKIIGIELRYSIATISELYAKEDFKKVKIATPKLISKINGIALA